MTNNMAMSPLKEVVCELLRILNATNLSIESVWYPEEWSKTYQVKNDTGNIWFLKGTPRSRKEAETVQLLWRESPESIPRLIASDIVPLSETRWFLLENAGTVSQVTTDAETAFRAVETLGRVQKKLEKNNELKTLLPDCSAQGLYSAMLAACTWIYETAEGEQNHLAQQYLKALRSSDAFFKRLAEVLGKIPPTIIHGDFWSGNWGVSGRAIRIFDWGDALWGVGGLSIASLLSQHGELTSNREVIWQVYGNTIERDIPPEYQQMCDYALDMASLVIDVEICRVCRRPPYGLDAMLKTWKRLNDNAAISSGCENATD